ncbi:MAG TPA: hypothetical protein VGQ51_07760, partial [Puia sp.]|nr:hypothetical protein [Puia sp.]
MSFTMNWLFDWLWKRRRVPRAALAASGDVALTAMVSEEEEGKSQVGSRSEDDDDASADDPDDASADDARADDAPTDDADEASADDTDDASTDDGDNDNDDERAAGEDAPEVRSVPVITSPGPLPIELKYLDELIRYRIGQVLHPHLHHAPPPMPKIEHWQLPIGQFILDYNKSNTPKLTDDDARLLLIALVDHVQPDLFDYSIHVALKGEGDFQPIGGTRGKNFRGFIPTGQTAVFLLGGVNWERDIRFQKLFWADH